MQDVETIGVINSKISRAPPITAFERVSADGAIEKLNSIGFDPISKLADKYADIDAIIDSMLLGPRPNMQALSTLIGVQRAIAKDLLAYGYRQASQIETPSGQSGGFNLSINLS